MQKQNIQKTIQNTKKDTEIRWKGILIFSVLIIGLGYLILFFLQKERLSSSSVSLMSVNTGMYRSESSSGGVETHTGKRIETMVQSGTEWGMSPFGSGKPLREDREGGKPKFMKPNTEWKTRTINGITYVFGEGNPKEVEKSYSELRPFDYYVTSETEYALKAFLDDPNFTKVMQKCGHILDWENKLEKPDWERFPDNLDMETMLVINPETKRKEISHLFLSVIEPRFSFLRSPVADPNKDPLRICLGEDYRWMDSVFQNMNSIPYTVINLAPYTIHPQKP